MPVAVKQRPGRRRQIALSAVVLFSLCTLAPLVQACTRAVYLGQDNIVVVGRSMDWMEDLHSNLWVFPRGMKRDGGLGPGSLEWTSRYGSLVTSVYEGGSVDGMNEKGLAANLLYLAESEYPPAGDDRPTICITAWAQYVLDQFASVSEAVQELEKEAFRMVSVVAPNGSEGTVHLAISDPSGDSAIFEYIGGKLVVHHGRQYQVMTNSPEFSQQLALNAYWEEIGGTVMLPGTNRAADRFARASFYINASIKTGDPREAIASTFSVIRNCSVPRGISTPDKPNIAATIWRVVADQKHRVYYFENTASPSLIWVRMDQLDFSAGSGVRKLTLVGQPDLAGDQTANFQPSEPFKFLAPEPKSSR